MTKFTEPLRFAASLMLVRPISRAMGAKVMEEEEEEEEEDDTDVASNDEGKGTDKADVSKK